MANKEDTPTKDQGAPASAPANPEGEAEGLISLDELDQVIGEQDPEFRGSIESIGSGENAADLNIELIDLDQLLQDQEAKSLKSRLKRLSSKFRNFLTGLKTTAWHFLRNQLPQLLKALLALLQRGMGHLAQMLRAFAAKPLRFKLLTLAFIVICGAAGTVVFVMLTRGLVPTQEPLFLQSLETISSKQYAYDPNSGREDFYGSVRVAQNIVVMPKLVANVRRSMNSSSNPMAAAEVYVEGLSPDVVVEIKDRETEFRDLFLRVIEGFSYDELASAEGKMRLQEQLVEEANRVVTTGRVRKVYFKTIVLKP